MLKYYEQGYNNLLFLPMFPQYSTTTTKSIANQIARVIKKNKIYTDENSISFIKEFHDNDDYIDSSVTHIQTYQKI